MASTLRRLRDRDRATARRAVHVFPNCIPFGKYRGTPMQLIPQKYLERHLQNPNLVESTQQLLLKEFERRAKQRLERKPVTITFGQFKGRIVSDLNDDEIRALSEVVRESNRERWRTVKDAVADEIRERELDAFGPVYQTTGP